MAIEEFRPRVHVTDAAAIALVAVVGAAVIITRGCGQAALHSYCISAWGNSDIGVPPFSTSSRPRGSRIGHHPTRWGPAVLGTTLTTARHPVLTEAVTVLL